VLSQLSYDPETKAEKYSGNRPRRQTGQT